MGRSKINEYFATESGEFLQIKNIPQISNLQFLQEVNACNSNFCQNGGTCIDNKDNDLAWSQESDGEILPLPDFQCECPFGYEGAYCENVINFCDQSPCQNDSKCVSLKGQGYYCECDEDLYSGKNCDVDAFCAMDECDPEGTEFCNAAKCHCNPSYFGKYCGQKDLCFENNCEHNEICLSTKTDAFCLPEGILGPKIDEQSLRLVNTIITLGIARGDMRSFFLAETLKKRILAGKNGFAEKFMKIYLLNRLRFTHRISDSELQTSTDDVDVSEPPRVSLKMATISSEQAEHADYDQSETLSSIDAEILDAVYQDMVSD